MTWRLIQDCLINAREEGEEIFAFFLLSLLVQRNCSKVSRDARRPVERILPGDDEREREREVGSRRRREVTRVTFFFTLGGLAYVKWRSRPRERPRSALSTSMEGAFNRLTQPTPSSSFLPRCANGFRATIASSSSSSPSRESRGLVFRRESTTNG